MSCVCCNYTVLIYIFHLFAFALFLFFFFNFFFFRRQDISQTIVYICCIDTYIYIYTYRDTKNQLCVLETEKKTCCKGRLYEYIEIYTILILYISITICKCTFTGKLRLHCVSVYFTQQQNGKRKKTQSFVLGTHNCMYKIYRTA